MKRFLLNIFMFAILVIALLGVPQYLFDYKAYQDNESWPFSVLNQVKDSEKLTAEFLVSGNSRGGHYLTATMEETFTGQVENMSFSGYPFDYQYYFVLTNYLQQKVHPTYILQEVGPFCFFDYINPTLHVTFLPYIYRPEAHFLFELNSELTPYDRFLPIKYRGILEKCYTARKELKPDLSEEDTPYCNIYSELKEDFPFEHDSNIIHTFSAFIHECDSLNIRLVLAISPMHTEDGIPRFAWDSFYHIMDSVTKGYDIPLLDYSQYFGNNTTFFKDPIHLNQFGSEIYTRQVMHDLDSIGFFTK